MSIEKDQTLTLAMIVVLAVLFCAVVWVPEHRRIKEYNKRIEAARQTLGPDFDETNLVTTRDTEVQRLRDRVSASDRYIPTRPDIASLIRDVTTAAKQEGIAKQQLETLQSKAYRHYNVIPVHLECDGKFPALFSLLGNIESMRRLVRVESLNLRLRPTADGDEVTATFRLSTFYTHGEGEGS